MSVVLPEPAKPVIMVMGRREDCSGGPEEAIQYSRLDSTLPGSLRMRMQLRLRMWLFLIACARVCRGMMFAVVMAFVG